MTELTMDVTDSVFVDTSLLLPLDKSNWDCACAICRKPQSRWELLAPKREGQAESEMDPASMMVCSLCFLYESRWGKRRAQALEETIRDVEKTDKAAFIRAPDSRLASIRDANLVLGTICIVSRAFQMSQEEPVTGAPV